jgi:bifunctional non-homologous end joining protein LigD
MSPRAKEPLQEYRKKRDFANTPEPAPAAPKPRRARQPRFVVQEHHARRLHWDLRLEHEGVLWSWAVPKGVPPLNRPNHLAVRTEDHPIEYLTFHGEIPKGQYGAGSMTIWDSGTYEAEKLRDDEVIVTLHGERVDGKYVLFHTLGDQWMIHRMSPPADPSREPIPRDLQPMLATSAETLPSDDENWAFEMKWDGMRVVLVVEAGQLTLTSRLGNDATSRFPELRALGDALARTDVVLDGEIVALADDGRPSFERLQPRMQAGSAAVSRRLASERSVVCMLFDVLWLDGHSTCDLPYRDRRKLLEKLALSGPTWQTPPTTIGDGQVVYDAAEELDMEGVVAKRLDSKYQPGRRSDAWRKVKTHHGQELVVGGWLSGAGRLDGRLGSLLVGYYDDGKLRYAGRVGSGLDERKRSVLEAKLAPLARDASPFDKTPKLPGPHWVEPEIVVDVRFQNWTGAGILRAPRYRGLRDDKEPSEVVRETR